MYELPILDTPWHIISSIAVFSLGLWHSIRQKYFFVPNYYASILYLWHTMFCIFYLYYSLDNIADSTAYFHISLEITEEFGLSTVGIYYFTSIFSKELEMSYLGVFLVYNIFGYIGLLALAAALCEITRNKIHWARTLALLIPLLPGANFWSAAIGKDALTFMGAGLAAWAFLKLKQRYSMLAIAVIVFLFARPHIAALLLASSFFAIILVAPISKARKVALTLLTSPVLVYGVIAGASLVGLDTNSSIQDLNEMVEYRQSVNVDGGSSINIADMNILMRMFAFMFRPLFFDTDGLMGMAVSFENLFLLWLALVACVKSVNHRSSLPKITFWFSIFFITMSWLMLGNTTANMGLALRQKWMFVPMLLMLFLSYTPTIGRGARAIGSPLPAT